MSRSKFSCLSAALLTLLLLWLAPLHANADAKPAASSQPSAPTAQVAGPPSREMIDASVAAMKGCLTVVPDKSKDLAAYWRGTQNCCWSNHLAQQTNTPNGRLFRSLCQQASGAVTQLSSTSPPVAVASTPAAPAPAAAPPVAPQSAPPAPLPGTAGAPLTAGPAAVPPAQLLETCLAQTTAPSPTADASYNTPQAVNERVRACCDSFPAESANVSLCRVARVADASLGGNLQQCFSNKGMVVGCCYQHDPQGKDATCQTLTAQAHQLAPRIQGQAPQQPQPGSPDCVAKTWEYLKAVGTAAQNTPEGVNAYCNPQTAQPPGATLPQAQVGSRPLTGNPANPPEFSSAKDCERWVRRNVAGGENFDPIQVAQYCTGAIGAQRALIQADRGDSNFMMTLYGGGLFRYELNREGALGGNLGGKFCFFHNQLSNNAICGGLSLQLSGRNDVAAVGYGGYSYNPSPNVAIDLGVVIGGGGHDLSDEEFRQKGDSSKKYFLLGFKPSIEVYLGKSGIRRQFGFFAAATVGYLRSTGELVTGEPVVDRSNPDNVVLVMPSQTTGYSRESFTVLPEFGFAYRR